MTATPIARLGAAVLSGANAAVSATEPPHAPASSKAAQPTVPSETTRRKPRRSDDSRQVPNYDGRPEPGPTSDDVALLLPRALFYPVHLAFEYLLRHPIVALAHVVERERWHLDFVDFFTWQDRQAGLVPTAFYQFGFIPSVGFVLFWNDFLAERNHLQLRAATGGTDWVDAWLRELVAIDGRTTVSVEGGVLRRPDFGFQGLGYASRRVDQARYLRQHQDVRLGWSLRPTVWSALSLELALTDNTFDASGYGPTDDASLAEAVADGRLRLPPGFDGYFAYLERLTVAVDSRRPSPSSRDGVRVSSFAELGIDLDQPSERRWVHYGGTVQGFLDLAEERMVEWRTDAELADPAGQVEVPFTELPALSGPSVTSFAGFNPGQLIGRSSVSTTLHYKYPIWVFLDAGAHVSVGNVFDERLRDFDVERLRLSCGLDIQTTSSAGLGLTLALAFGTRPFDAGTDIENVRLVLGASGI